MEDLLKLWSVPEEVIEAFQKNAINETHLYHISDDQLKELCPVMGIRIDLRKRITEYLDAQAPTETVTNCTGTSTPDVPLMDLHDENIKVLGDLSFSFNEFVQTQSSFKEFDLKTLLATSPCGKSILEYYNTNGCLDTKRRNRLTDIIIRHLFTFIVNHQLSYDDYTIIAGKIITLFPKEAAATYFTRPIKKNVSHTGKSVAARGKLIDKVRNVLFESGERKRKRDSKNTEEEEPKFKRLRESLLEIDQEDIEWLGAHDEPWSEVISKWRNTAAVRYSKDYENIEHFMSQWTILNNPKAVELIEVDFNFLYPEQVDNFSKNWHNFFDNLIALKKTDISADIYRENLFASLKYMDLEEKRCLLPIETGDCDGVLPRYAYEKNVGCIGFVYGGCGGNKNRFNSPKKCKAACDGHAKLMKTGDDKTCLLPIEKGCCGAHVPRYAFETRKGCVKFTYSGCEGNKNNFRSLKECESTCQMHKTNLMISEKEPMSSEMATPASASSDESPPESQLEPEQKDEKCYVPIKPGHCYLHYPKYGYSQKEGCIGFIYTGCGGNGNQFDTREECEATCE